MTSTTISPAYAAVLPITPVPARTTRLVCALNLAFAAWMAAGLHSHAHAEEAVTSAKESGKPVQLDAVEINGRLDRRPAGPVARRGRLGVLGDTEVMDAPFSVINYTAQTIQNQQAASAADVVANDASVSVSAAPGGMLDALYIRGFPISEGNFGEFAFDGVFGVAPNYRVLSDYAERVELIKGPTALLYGMAPNSSVGGSINIVPKRAADTDLTQVGVDFASASQLGTRIDLSRRMGPGREFGVRVNGSVREGDTALDRQSRKAQVGAVALDYQGTQFRATLDAIAQSERFDAPSRPFLLSAGVDAPAAPDGRRNVTQEWEWSKVDDQAVLLRGEYDITSKVTVFADAGTGRTQVDRVFGTPTLLNSAGDVQWTPAHFQFDVRRATADAGVRAQFDTGPVRHAVSLQASQYRDTLERGSVNGTAVVSNIYAPTASAEQAVAAPASLAKISETELTGVALADTLAMFDRQVLLTLGLRGQQVKSDNFNATTGALSLPRHDQRATTPLVGLVVKPWAGVSLYGNYIEGLSKGDTAPTAASNAGEVLAPYKARQYEAGVKIDHGRLTTTLSAFQISKPSGQLTGTVFAADAEQRNRGLELNVAGEASTAVRVLSGITLMDAELTKSSDATRLGKRPIGVPAVQGNAGLEWDTPFAPELTLTGGLFYTGKQYANAANTASIPAWTRVDAGARYQTAIAGKTTTLRATVRNLLDRDYWSGVASYGGLAQGAPRTVQLSAAIDF